jgi:mRNA export factor
VLASAGSDGTLFIWDLGRHQRLKSLPALDGAITAMAFSSSTSNTSNTNNNRDKLVYAVGYDWAKGYRGNTATYPRRIVLCDVGDLGSGKK